MTTWGMTGRRSCRLRRRRAPPPVNIGRPMRHAAVPVPNLFSFLRGSWRLRRTLVDRRAGATLVVLGTAAWLADAPSAGPPLLLYYSETGELQRAGAPPTPTRAATRWIAVAGAPAAARVEFEDGRPFHDVDLATGCCAAAHDCAPDSYAGTLTAGEDTLTIFWRVTGPAKDYDSTTLLTREG